ncbi:MAG: aminotransferase class I/II-fold pyridoxal phosphate-dependent enzyme [Frankiales bacterium]|nr:aminotransferase class I/II-fold pyridoxal phosphate-dependent enzyme [Frankiales bacterium]
MDALPAPAVVDAVCAAMSRGDTGYPPMDTSYAEAFSEAAARHWGWAPDPAATCVVADVLAGVREVLRLVTRPGDAVVVPAPVYPPLLEFTAAMGRRVVPVPLGPDDRLDLDAVAAALAEPDATALLLCSPHNPTGTVHTADELRGAAAVADAAGATVVVDEIHGLLVPEGTRFTPYLAVAERGFVVTSASKAYNLAGLKAGLVVAGPASAALVEQIPLEARYGASYLGVLAHVAAWRHGDAWLDAVNAAIAANAEHLGRLLAEHLPQVGYRPPQATYLAWLDVSALGLGEDPAETLVERAGVALSSGLPFGPGGEQHVRLNLAASRATLATAVERIAAALA